MSSDGRKLIGAILREGNLAKYIGYGDLTAIYELDAHNLEHVKFVSDYVAVTGKLPSVEVFEDEQKTTLLKDETDAQWLFDKVKDRHLTRKLKLIGEDTKKLLGEDPRKAMEAMEDGLMSLRNSLMVSDISDFNDSITSLYPKLTAQWNGTLQSIKTGWPSLDKFGSLIPGDLLSLVGRPGRGKSWLLLWICLYIWETYNTPIVFFSMEMNREQVETRLAAMYTSIEADFFKDGIGGTLFSGKNLKVELKESLMTLQKAGKPPFIIIDSNLASTVDDVFSMVRMYKPGLAAVDGGYLLTNNYTRGESETVATNCKLIKQRITPLCPTAVTWQFSRKAEELKKGEEPGLQHIGYSDAIGQLSSIALGLWDDDNDTSNVEKMIKKKILIMKGRGGQIGEFFTDWDFERMKFAEFDKSSIPDIYGI